MGSLPTLFNQLYFNRGHPAEADRCCFFNPLSVEILKSVLAKIIDSYHENPREIQLFFYYPSDEYAGYLMTQDELMFVDETYCRIYSPEIIRRR